MMRLRVGVVVVLAVVVTCKHDACARTSGPSCLFTVCKANPEAYARVGPNTKILHAYAQRYAPQEWPKWYTWTLVNQNGGLYYRLVGAPGRK
jgi:hypothetical protein